LVGFIFDSTKSSRVDEQLLVPLVFQKRLRQCFSRFQVIIHQFSVQYFDFEFSIFQSIRGDVVKVFLFLSGGPALVPMA